MNDSYKHVLNVTDDELKLIQNYRSSSAKYQKILLSTALAGMLASPAIDNVIQLFQRAS